MEQFKKIIILITKYVLAPLTVGIIVYFVTHKDEKDKTEITFKLDGYVILGEDVGNAGLPNLRLMLDSISLKNILVVSWKIINTGNQGIKDFEIHPVIEYAGSYEILTSRISNKSSLINSQIQCKVNRNSVFIDSMGIFNPNEFIKVDIILKNVNKDSVSIVFFKEWNLKLKALNLQILKDFKLGEKIENKTFFDIISLPITIISIILTVFVQLLSPRMRTWLFKKTQR